jgi:hypothetical protein
MVRTDDVRCRRRAISHGGSPEPSLPRLDIKHYSSLITEALEEVHHPNPRIRFVVADSRDTDAGCHSIDERFDRVDQQVAAIRRDVGLILEKLTGC